jgi:hypothetical protein
MPSRPVNLTPSDAFAMIAAHAAWHHNASPPPQVVRHVAGQKERSYVFPTRGWHRWH